VHVQQVEHQANEQDCAHRDHDLVEARVGALEATDVWTMALRSLSTFFARSRSSIASLQVAPHEVADLFEELRVVIHGGSPRS
jgi:hypothetical protein